MSNKNNNPTEENPFEETIKRLDKPLPSTKKILRDARGQFLPGDSGNPGGRPAGSLSFTNILIRRLERFPSEAAAIVDAIIKLAKMGDIKAIDLIWERLDGKVVEKHLIEGEMPVTIQFVPAQRLIESQAMKIETLPLKQLEGGVEPSVDGV